MNQKGVRTRGSKRAENPPGERPAQSRKRRPTARPKASANNGQLSTHPVATGAETAMRRTPLNVEVVWADITQAVGDVHFVGHYMGVRPQRAVAALDCAVSGCGPKQCRKHIIAEATKRGVLRGPLGDVSFFPWDPNRVVAVAGMGRPGTFHRPQLKILARSIARSVGLLPERSIIATVLIGSGRGNLAVRDAALGLVEGIIEALNEDPSLRVDKLRIVERDLDRALDILDVLSASKLQEDSRLNLKTELIGESGGTISTDFGCSLLLASLTDAGGELQSAEGALLLHQLLATLPGDGRLSEQVRTKLDTIKEEGKKWSGPEKLHRLAMCFRLREADQDASRAGVPARVAFWADGQDVLTTAITNSVTVTERQIAGRMPLVERAIEQLMDPPSDQLEELATALYRLLVHSDVKTILESSESLIVEVDRRLSRVQWELLPAAQSDGKPLGVAHPVARQLRTPYSQYLEEAPTGRELRALVIGDPGDPASGHQLEEARAEAREVKQLLEGRKIKTDLLIGAPEDGTGAGPLHKENIPPADYFVVVKHLLSGNFDIVHYCGHAEFDPDAPDRAGWVFKGGLLTGRELEGMERPPSLVVANACLTARFAQPQNPVAPKPSGTPTPRYDARLVASLAEEFFRRGISDYIGTAWAVPSNPARTFARSFYEWLLAGKSIGEAVQQARMKLYDLRPSFGESASVWAAYQHYGDPTRVFHATRGADKQSRR